ncbi:MAG: SIMPL domain-containing protein [Chloroflexi bacterium]|nr:SIMPL domain-containing protein [Chloroflexota bacterium]
MYRWHLVRWRLAVWAVRLLAAIALALAGSSTAALASPASQVTPTPETIVVTADGEATAPPDVAYVTVGVVTQAPTAAQATADNARQLAAVVDALRGRGIAEQDLQTSGLSVQPLYAQGRAERQDITGYQAINNVTVTVNDLARAGELLDAALAAGANRVGGLRFAVRDTTSLRQQALGNAVRAARAQAEAIAAGLGVRLSSVHSVVEEAVAVPVPRAVMAMEAPAAAPGQPPTPVLPGELRVTARVRVAFSFQD